MNHVPVTSSNIKSVGYDAASATLEILFHNGARWQYSPVPEEEHERLMSARSIGSHFHTHIKSNPSYAARNMGTHA